MRKKKEKVQNKILEIKDGEFDLKVSESSALVQRLDLGDNLRVNIDRYFCEESSRGVRFGW